MRDYMVLLRIAEDEIKTIIDYTEMLDNQADAGQDIKPAVDEILGDEFNHALIAILMAAKIMGVKIATDDISPDPNNTEVE